MPVLQELIHRLEVGGGLRKFERYVYRTIAVLAVLALFGAYNYRCYTNFSTSEAMDAAQLGRNLAEGRGYTTQFIRPFSMFLLKQASQPELNLAANARPDPFRIRGAHPDISNPPLYSVVLAGLMSMLPFNYQSERTNWFWSYPGRLPDSRGSTASPRLFARYQPEFVIALFNQALFGVCILLTFRIARRLFDPMIAWISAVLMLGTELLWRLSTSGLSTMLLMTVFLGVTWMLILLDAEFADEKRPVWRAALLALAAGLLLGAGGLTRYSFSWLILPLLAWLAIFAGKSRWLHAFLALLAFASVMTPWIIRNVEVSGTPFGTAGYAIVEGSASFPEFRLQRSIDPNLNFQQNAWGTLVHKLVTHSRQIVQSDLPRLGGTWASGFFLAGLLVSYRKISVRRLRYFIVGCVPLLAIAQALGSTQISVVYPDINTENLLVLLTPLVIIYGTSLFLLLLDTVELPVPKLRYAVIGAFICVVTAPLLLALCPPSRSPLAWPPYHPPAIQKIAGWMKPDALTMSDVPWAVAWYGNRQSSWLTLDTGKDYLEISDYQKPIQLLYLTRLTLESRVYSDFIREGKSSWGGLVAQRALTGKVPADFPLHTEAPGWLPEFLVLTDSERWRRSSDSEVGSSKSRP